MSGWKTYVVETTEVVRRRYRVRARSRSEAEDKFDTDSELISLHDGDEEVSDVALEA